MQALGIFSASALFITSCSSTSAQIGGISSCQTSQQDYKPLEIRLPDRNANLFAVQVNGMWGLIKDDGQVVLPPQWSYIDGFFEGRAIFKGKDGKLGFLDERGEIIVPAKFEEVQRFNGNRAAVRLDGKWGYIDRTGRLVISAQYASASPFYEHRAFVVRHTARTSFNSVGGFIDENGQSIGEERFSEGSRFNEGVAIARLDTGSKVPKVSILDNAGNLKILKNVHIYEPGMFRNGLAPAIYVNSPQEGKSLITDLLNSRNDEQSGFINHEGEFAIQPKFESVGEFSDGIAPVKQDGKWGLITSKGDFLLKPQFENQPLHLGCGLILIEEWKTVIENLNVTINGMNRQRSNSRIAVRYGLIDIQGQRLSPTDKEYIGQISEGFLLFELNGKKGFMDTTGKVIITPQFDQATAFYSGRSKVRINGKEHYIDRTGTIIW
jgi:WG containing repeat